MPHPDKCSCPTVEDTAGELTRLFSEFIFILAKCKCSGKNGFTETSNSEGKTRVRNGSAFGKGTNEIKPFMRYTRTQPKGSARSDRSESNRAHVGNKYVGNEGEAVAPDARLLCTTSPISKRAQCGQVRRLIETGDVDTTGLRKESADSYYAHGGRSNPIEDVRKGVASARRTRTTETNACNYSRPSKTVEKKSKNIREHDGSFVLENGSSLDGNGGTFDRTDIKGYSRRGSDLLGKSNEVNENEPLSTVYVRDCDGPRNCRVSGLHETNTQGCRMCYTEVSRMDSKIREILGNGYGAHSIKRGAITWLFQEVAQGNLTISEVQNMTKHLNVESLLKYNANQVTTARALGTQRVSARLPA